MIVHIEDLRAARCACRQSDYHRLVAPGFTCNGKDLLIHTLPIHGRGVGRVTVGCGGELRLHQLVPFHAAIVNIARRRQNALRCRLIRVGVDAETVNAPCAEKVAPERGFRGVVRFLDCLET